MVPEDGDDAAATVLDSKNPATTLAAPDTDALGPTMALPSLAPSIAELPSGPRYASPRLIAEGGMGEVHLCEDRHVGREVAMKVVHPRHRARRDLEMRFLREARVQGQLEHPSIVPVYDIGRDDQGNLFFTMKRLAGTTLEDVLAKKQQPRHRLLAAFASLCQAVHYAHVRGVVHRDLKPANVALGDFGEVYILDWGLAKVMKEADVPSLAPSIADTSEGKTEAGIIMGTPGYMSPEQARGEDVDARTDVFALGAILFEILTGEPLLGDGSIAAIMVRTQKPIEARPSVRSPESAVPPELETICMRATALEPDKRYPTAGALYEAVDRYLAGDRDLELRRSIASAHIERARAHAKSKERALALKEAGRAAAVDPTNPDGLRILLELLSDTPRELPKEVEEEMRRDNTAENLRFAPIFALSCACVPVLSIPLYYLMGVRSWPLVLASMAFWIASAVWLRTFPGRIKPEHATLGAILLLSASIASIATIMGPLVLTPGVAIVFSITTVMTVKRKFHPLVILLGVSAIVVPLMLEWAGVLPPSYRFENGTITIVPRVVAFPKMPAMALFLIGQLFALTGGSLTASFVNRQLAQARERLYLQTWELRALAPEQVTEASRS